LILILIFYKVISAKSVPLIKNSNKIDSKFKDKNFNFKPSIKYLDKYNDFSYRDRTIIKQKYFKLKGIYLWINNINNKSYVGKSVNLYLRISKYFSCSALRTNYIYTNKSKMIICEAIFK
jgi:GIY-YIG catalytic domain